MTIPLPHTHKPPLLSAFFPIALDIPSILFVLTCSVHLLQQKVSFVQQSNFVQHCISSE